MAKEKTVKDSGFQYSKPLITNLRYELPESYNETLPSVQGRKIGKSIEKTDSHSAVVEVTWETGTDEQSVNPKQQLSISMGAKFYWDDSIDDEKAELLLNYNAVTILFGYIRPIVATISMNAAEEIDIPFIDLSSEN